MTNPRAVPLALAATTLLAGPAGAALTPADEMLGARPPSILRMKACEPTQVRPWLITCGRMIYRQVCTLATTSGANGAPRMGLACTWVRH